MSCGEVASEGGRPWMEQSSDAAPTAYPTLGAMVWVRQSL